MLIQTVDCQVHGKYIVLSDITGSRECFSCSPRPRYVECFLRWFVKHVLLIGLSVCTIDGIVPPDLTDCTPKIRQTWRYKVTIARAYDVANAYF